MIFLHVIVTCTYSYAREPDPADDVPQQADGGAAEYNRTGESRQLESLQQPHRRTSDVAQRPHEVESAQSRVSWGL